MTTEEKSLSEMVADYMALPGNVPEPRPESEFVVSGLRAAMSANTVIRRKIISEVSNILHCKSEDLEFLFTEFGTTTPSTSKYEVMVPDFQTELYDIAE